MRNRKLNYAVMTHKEVADKLGVTYQTVQKIEKRAIAKIKNNKLANKLANDYELSGS